METTKEVEVAEKPMNSRGAARWQRLLDQKREISQHIQNGGELTDLTHKYRFFDPLSVHQPE